MRLGSHKTSTHEYYTVQDKGQGMTSQSFLKNIFRYRAAQALGTIDYSIQ